MLVSVVWMIVTSFSTKIRYGHEKRFGPEATPPNNGGAAARII